MDGFTLEFIKAPTFRGLIVCCVVGRALASGQVVSIHPSSVMFGKKSDCVIFNELVRTTQQYIRSITRIDSLWLAELAPRYFSTMDMVMNSRAGFSNP